MHTEIEVLKAKLAAAEKILKQVKVAIEDGMFVDMDFSDIWLAVEFMVANQIEVAIDEYMKGSQDAI